MKRLALYLLVGAALLGCGDEEPNVEQKPTSNPSVKLKPSYVEGFTEEGEFLEGLVDDDSRLWFTYAKGEGEGPGQNEKVLGFIKSNNAVLLNNDNFTALGKNYSYDGRSSRNITVTGNYKAAEVISGTFFEQPSNPIKYNLKLNTLLNKRQTLNLIDNRIFTGPLYVTSGTGAVATTITFTTNGNFTSIDSKGCTSTGKLTPVASERYFTSTVTFSQINCDAAGETHAGVSRLDDNNLLLLATNGAAGRGMYFGSL